MRSEQQMLDLVITQAKHDDRIRAVIMNGSRVNPTVRKDCFQDYDIVYIVKELNSFIADHSWVDHFGERLIMQLPDESPLYPDERRTDRFAYLMQFKDGNRIDLTLQIIDSLPAKFDSLSKVLLDKDSLLPDLTPSNDSDYRVSEPTEDSFKAVSNEFWWVSLYVAKGLWRGEVPYAKAMMEGPVREMLKTMISWSIGLQTNFSVSVGKEGKYFKDLLDPETYQQYLLTYSDAKIENNWDSLFLMAKLFLNAGELVAEAFGFSSPYDEQVQQRLVEIRNSSI
ncbi:aminoglycoside 6-adenylyltransferase [Halobacillus fulvus]|nr:aminoglycoside 6-adenylyltransferase [Halobacillus fulvus]